MNSMLRWNPTDFGGIQEARFIQKDGKYPIWIPDVLLYNSVEERFNALYPSNIVVNSEGEATWIPPAVLKFSCKIDITWFPFDDQGAYSRNKHAFTM